MRDKVIVNIAMLFCFIGLLILLLNVPYKFVLLIFFGPPLIISGIIFWYEVIDNFFTW